MNSRPSCAISSVSIATSLLLASKSLISHFTGTPPKAPAGHHGFHVGGQLMMVPLIRGRALPGSGGAKPGVAPREQAAVARKTALENEVAPLHPTDELARAAVEAALAQMKTISVSYLRPLTLRKKASSLALSPSSWTLKQNVVGSRVRRPSCCVFGGHGVVLEGGEVVVEAAAKERRCGPWSGLTKSR